jgi:hypothetical protein
MNQTDKAKRFAELHVKGAPLLLYNAWDAGSAKSILAAGAQAIAGFWASEAWRPRTGLAKRSRSPADQRIILQAGNEEAGRTGGRLCPWPCPEQRATLSVDR